MQTTPFKVGVGTGKESSTAPILFGQHTQPSATTSTPFSFGQQQAGFTKPTQTTPFKVDHFAIAKAAPDQNTLAERNAQVALFTGVVLRDAYAFLLNPSAPNVTAPRAQPPMEDSPPHIHLGAALLGKRSTAGGAIDTFAFADRATLPRNAQQLPDGWTLLDDETTLSALDHLGETWPLALAATEAFEMYLTRKAATWSPSEAASFSVEFLVAFGRELTARLDVHHRIRSTRLTKEEITILTSSPFAMGVDQNVLRRFQQPTLSVATNVCGFTTPHIALHERKSPELSTAPSTTAPSPTASITLLTPRLAPPDTPSLPASPRNASAPLAASSSACSELFKKVY